MSTRTDPFVTYTALVRSRGNGAPKCRDLTEEHRRDEGGAQQGRVDLRRYQQKRGNGEQHLLPHPRAHQHETGEGSTDRKSTRLNSSHSCAHRMTSSA